MPAAPLFMLMQRTDAPPLTVESLTIKYQPALNVLHCAYGCSDDNRWLAAVWTDSDGELLRVHVSPLIAKSPTDSGSYRSPESDVVEPAPAAIQISSSRDVRTPVSMQEALHSLWRITRSIAEQASGNWCVVVSRLGSISAPELQVWEGFGKQLSSSSSAIVSLSVALLEVVIDTQIWDPTGREVDTDYHVGRQHSKDGVLASELMVPSSAESASFTPLLVFLLQHDVRPSVSTRDEPLLAQAPATVVSAIVSQLHALSWLSYDVVGNCGRLSNLPFHALILARLLSSLVSL